MQPYIKLITFALLVPLISACSAEGQLFPPLTDARVVYEKPPTIIRQPVVPEMLAPCNGHVLVPALGMTFVRRGTEVPVTGQYIREERLSPPYRIIPPGGRLSAEQSPTRVNIEIDDVSRITGLFCG